MNPSYRSDVANSLTSFVKAGYDSITDVVAKASSVAGAILDVGQLIVTGSLDREYFATKDFVNFNYKSSGIAKCAFGLNVHNTKRIHSRERRMLELLRVCQR